MELMINEGVVSALRQHGFYPDTMITSLCAMKALHQKEYDFFNWVEDSDSSKRMNLIYYDLVKREIWKEAKEGKVLYEFTPEGQKFYEEELKPLFYPNLLKAVNRDRTASMEHWIHDWVELWPKGVKSGGKLLRSDFKTIYTKMKAFMKEYPEFDKNLIFSATKGYLAEQKAKGWNYTKCATYFILKRGEGSELASRCELLKDLGDEHRLEEADGPQTSYFV